MSSIICGIVWGMRAPASSWQLSLPTSDTDSTLHTRSNLHYILTRRLYQCLSNSELFNYVYWDLLVFCLSLCLPHCHDQLLLAVTSCQLPVSRDTRAWQHVSTASCGKTSWQHISRCIKEKKQQVFTNLTSIFLGKKYSSPI